MLLGKQSRGRERWDCEKYFEPAPFNLINGDAQAGYG